MYEGRDPDVLRRLKALSLRFQFGAALRSAREARGLSQEAFGKASSRTYISSLERGQKSPTLDKVEKLAPALGLHPLTLHAYTYLRDATPQERSALLRLVQAELRKLLAYEASRGRRRW